MTTPDALQLDHVRVSDRKIRVTARRGGEPVHIDTIDPSSAVARQRFTKALCEKLPEAAPEAVETELVRLAATAPSRDGGEGDQAGPREDAAKLLNEMPQDIRDEADALLADPMLIKQIMDDVAALDVAGERELIATVFFIGVSRLLDRPLAGIVQGPSSSGKSYLIERT